MFWLATMALICASSASCVDRPGHEKGAASFRVTFLGGQELGSPSKPILFSNTPIKRRIRIEALDESGAVDSRFNGKVVIQLRPTGKLINQPFSVKLDKGVLESVEVEFKQAYGSVRLVVTDEAFDQAPIDKLNEAACSNGKDDDGDGYVDFPDDRGCYGSADQSEGGGTNIGGASSLIYFSNPRVADVQRPESISSNADLSPLQGQRIRIDRGFVVVVRVGVDGMYLTDFDGVKWDGAKFTIDPVNLSYRSVFAFNFSTPRNLQEGDCLVQVDGTVEEFFGYTELGKPTWKKGDIAFCGGHAQRAGLARCEPRPRSNESEGAFVARQEGCRKELEALANTPFDLTTMMVDSPTGGKQRSIWNQRMQETERFESALIQLSNMTVFSEARKCDRNGNGLVDFSDNDEKTCANDCGKDPRCIVLETYRQYNQWTVNFVDGEGSTIEVAVVSSGAIPKFDPLKAQGKKLGKVVGTLRHLVFGKPPWIMEPRRKADCPDCVNK